MFYAKNDADRLGLKIADFDLCNTRHLYDVQKNKTLCGQHKNCEPIGVWEPEYYTNICNRCEQILKTKSNKSIQLAQECG